MEATAERAARAIDYQNAGTFEFLLGPEGSFYFIELNARLQVEHPVSELVTGIDLVHEQMRVAAGDPLEQTGRARRNGHAIEVRVNAEDPARDFLPMPGRVERFRPPSGPGVRVDTHIEEGSVVPPHYDSLLAKVVVWAPDRERALARCLRALNEFEVTGLPTTIGAAAQVIRSEGFARGNYSTSYLEDVAETLPALVEATS
jgi:acetyl-CoA carboxylase biotin carboxylase subunit